MFIEISDIVFSAGHFLVGARKELCEHLHGHNFNVTARIYGGLDENSMIIDFRFLKRILKSSCSKYDHRVLLPLKSRFVQIEERGNTIYVQVHGNDYAFPKEDVVKLPVSNTTTEELSKLICSDVLFEIKGKMQNIDAVRISVEELKGHRASCYKVVDQGTEKTTEETSLIEP